MALSKVLCSSFVLWRYSLKQCWFTYLCWLFILMNFLAESWSQKRIKTNFLIESKDDKRLKRENRKDHPSAIWTHQLNRCSFDKGGYRSLGSKRSFSTGSWKALSKTLKEKFRALQKDIRTFGLETKIFRSGLPDRESDTSRVQLRPCAPTVGAPSLGASELLTWTPVNLLLIAPSPLPAGWFLPFTYRSAR